MEWGMECFRIFKVIAIECDCIAFDLEKAKRTLAFRMLLGFA
jgi:hypothetical protein